MPGVVLGDFEITYIPAAVYWWDGGAFFGVVPKTLWSRKAAADELNRIQVAFNCYIVRTGEHTVLIETGGGDKLDARARERMRLPPEADPLPEIIARNGIDPESIDVVINSHLHFDHCGGNTNLTAATPVAAFPRARYFASRHEWEHAHERHVRDRISYNDENYDPLVKSAQMVLVDGGHQPVPGLRMRRAPGHNRDMMIVTAESRGQTFCFLSDLVPTAAHVQPTWVAAVDLFPLESIETKQRWLSAAAEQHWLCGFGHDASVPFARIASDPKTGFVARPFVHM
jgi:glyoxylase-like metal-dependent hydrolase (beta-lactamase superfamily II)